MKILQDITDFFISGGLFMYPLLLCSIILGMAIVLRWLTVRTSRISPPALVGMIEECLEGRGNLQQLAEAVKGGSSPLAQLTDLTLNSEVSNEEALRQMVEVRAKDLFSKMQVGLPIIDMIVMVAPMFGILGTASGLVIVFSVFGTSESQQEISRGIANALNTTITGLAIATPGVIASVCFSRQMERNAASMEVLISELITLRYKQERQA